MKSIGHVWPNNHLTVTTFFCASNELKVQSLFYNLANPTTFPRPKGGRIDVIEKDPKGHGGVGINRRVGRGGGVLKVKFIFKQGKN